MAASSRATMRSVSSTAARVIAAGTSRKARCVVTSATRSGDAVPAPVSIITTRGVRVRWAKNSVCPENGIPASCSTLFCTGAVTSAAKAPVAQPSAARESISNTLGALLGSGWPGVTGTPTGWCQISRLPSVGGSAAGE